MIRIILAITATVISTVLVTTCAASNAIAAEKDVFDVLRQRDGVVVLYRHAIAPGGGDPAGFQIDECATQRNLSQDGRSQARRMGRELKSERVPVINVRSSRWCRALQTARLMNIGKVQVTPALNSVFTASSAQARRQQSQTERLIRTHRSQAGVLVLVGHQANIIDLTGIAPESGEGVVVRMNQTGKIIVLGRVPAP